MSNQSETLRAIMRDIAEGNDAGEQLVYDRNNKIIRPSSPSDDPDQVMRMTNQDLGLFGAKG